MWNDLTSNVYSFFTGGLLFLVVYHLIIYAQNRKSYYLYYSFYMLCLALYLLQWNLGMPNDIPIASTRALLLCLSGGFYLCFVNTLVDFKTLNPKWNRILDRASKIAFALNAPLILVYFLGPEGLNYQIMLFNLYALAYIIFAARIFYQLYKINTIYSRYLLLGSTFYFIGAVLTFFTSFFISIADFSERFGFQLLSFTVIGITLEAIVFAVIIGYRNKETERLKLLSEENEKLEAQKVITLMKDQELRAIDAMLTGQEKERQRLASDLHDSVGATLSAAKMQFEYLNKHQDQLENKEQFFTKTRELLDKAYRDVRSFSHAKNSGVMAQDGLLPAIHQLIKTNSIAGALEIELQQFGLNDRLDATVEISIFRIIQELITNVIKHAKASFVSISLTKHENFLSIVVEDDGQGFKGDQKTLKQGMGLSSIETRVEHWEGTMEIDSRPGKGSSILIDIPL
ncbi:sensor histidine kinase [Gilvibacter sediminis]|uniref:sensor histidine kinase n=1 Tax=Gilvibacter sediminis TaxID=379071 RepID=UPI0023503A9B|nr:sensor histidine kinase [Gilvibacter sediminis]MDC7999326.1 sensor histidine kinase [Gilvibacter sediminis]